ncbi:hypothetical protein QU38_00555, partial [Staphylococcus aureus]
GMADVDQHAQPVHLGHPLLAERRKAVPLLRLVGGAVAELVVAEMDRPGHPHALGVIPFEQAPVGAQRIAVLDRLEDDALARLGDAIGILGGGGELHLVGIGRHDALDPHLARERRVACLGIAFRRQRPLAGID